MIDCLRQVTGLSILASTADQRALLGQETFLRTHTPVKFVQYRPDTRPTVWSEHELVQRLWEVRGVPRGNRIFLLYGAAGSGKSETLRWIQASIERDYPDRARSMVRIPRTALDPVRITHEILRHYGLSGLDAQLDRWESLKQKPVALANQVIWGALGDLLTRDHDIIPLSYKLRPLIEDNLRAGISSMNKENSGAPLELLTREQLREALQASAIVSELPYEAFLSRLREEFDHAVMGDVRLSSTLKALSQTALNQWGTRPILLIDDLVQSLNVYASDLLDYFLTLEEGDWDVVIGLTPASFEGSERTRELLQRINHLDTVDDRVTRLYLSDVRGDDSSFLTDESVSAFVEKYLLEIKRAHGFTCDEACSGYSTCHALQLGQIDHAHLSPFNPALLRRIFANLPRSKGIPRYLLTAIRELLEAGHQGTEAWLGMLRERVNRSTYAETADLAVKTFAEAYGWDGNAPGQVVIPATIHSMLTGGEGPLGITVHVLDDHDQSEESPTTNPVIGRPHNTDSQAVRDWLEDRPVNKELLKPLRLGIARWVKDMVDPTRLSGWGSLKPSGILRWAVQAEDSEVPIRLESLDTDEGIPVPRSLGLAAFDLVEYGAAQGRGKESLLPRLLNNPLCYGIIMDAERWQKGKLLELEYQLGMPLDQFSHHLGLVILGIPDSEADWTRHAISPLPGEGLGFLVGMTPSRRERQLASVLWEDVFRIRDNVYRASALWSYHMISHDQALQALVKIAPNSVDTGWKIGSMRLKEYLQGLSPKLVTLNQLNEHLGIKECLTRLIATSRLNEQITSPTVQADLKRSIRSLNRAMAHLPLPLRHQLPDLVIPLGGEGLFSNGLVEMAELAVAHPQEVPSLATYRLVSQALMEMSTNRAIGLMEWEENVKSAARVIMSWGQSDLMIDPEASLFNVSETLRSLASALRSCITVRSDSNVIEPGVNAHRWDRRLQTIETLLPSRSALRLRYADTLRSVKRRGHGMNWAQMESLVGRVVQSWRSIQVIARILPVSTRFEGLNELLDDVLVGAETQENLDEWAPRLGPALRSLQVAPFHGREFSRLLVDLSNGLDLLPLCDIPASALEELHLYFPQIYRSLRVTVG